MSENQILMPQDTRKDDENISLLDLLITLSKYKKSIAGITLAAALIAAGISLRLPDIYTATVKILPPQQNQSSANAFLSQLGGVAGMAGGKFGMKNPDDLYIAILKSRNVLEKVALRFDLQKVYGTKNLNAAIQRLSANVSATSGKEGIISVGVNDQDPKLAADLANAVIDAFDKTLQTFSLTDASQRRRFFEQQLKGAKDKLTDAEQQLDRTRNTSMQYLDVLRDAKYRESIYDILARQYEMAKLDEAKDYPLVQVMDRAQTPEQKSKPKRGAIVAMTAALAFVLAIFLAFIREMLGRGKGDPQHREKLELLKRSFSVRR